jgi:Ca-activated chloride channel family protein
MVPLAAGLRAAAEHTGGADAEIGMNAVDFLHAFHFLRPQWLLAMPPLWALAVWLARRRGYDGDWSGLIDAQLLPALRLDSGSAAGMRPWPWLALAWTIAVLALAGPSWQREQGTAYRSPAAWVFVLDLSPSMAAADIAPNRITRARYALDDLLGAARDTRVALVVFSDEAYVVTPLTQDVATVRTLLPPLAPDIMPSPGDHLAPALEQAGKLLRQAGGKDQRIVVLTDGFDDPAAAFSAAAVLKARGVTLNVVGIGTANGAPQRSADGGFVQDRRGVAKLARLDTERLRQLASSGGGEYADIAQLPGLIADLRAAPRSASGAVAVQGMEVAQWRDAGVWLLPLLLMLAALLARRRWL